MLMLEMLEYLNTLTITQCAQAFQANAYAPAFYRVNHVKLVHLLSTCILEMPEHLNAAAIT